MGSGQSVAGKREIAEVDQVAEAAQFATAGGLDKNELSTRVELSVRVQNLRRRVSAFVAVLAREGNEERWAEIGQTEIIEDSDSPAFVRSIVVRFAFEVQQRVRLEVRVQGGVLGFSDCFLAEVISGKNGQIRRPVQTSDGTIEGEMFIAAEELGRRQNLVTMDLRIEGLPVTDMFTRSCDPYILVSRTNPAMRQTEVGYKAPVYRGELQRRTRQPHWKSVTVTEQQLCRSDEMRLVEFEIFDWNYRGSHELVGTANTTYKDVKKGFTRKQRVSLQLLKQKKQRGKLHIENISLTRQYTFLDFIQGGLEVCLLVGIDFSRSNGDPAFPDSLHFFNTDQPNDYVMAIKALGEILEHYDTDKKYPVYGFGAKMPPTYAIGSDCFAVKGNYFDPEVDGVVGIVDAYREALQTVRLHGPTALAPLVRLAGQWAQTAEEANATEASKYFILLIITDGDVTDMQQTIDAVVKCSRLPLSIVVVGVGQSDFAELKILDADDQALFSVEEQKYMERDIVQFVPLDDFKDRTYHELAMAVLDEVPRELVGFFRARGIAPKSEVQAEKESQAIFVNQFKKKVDEKIPKFLKEERDVLIKSVVAQGYNADDTARVIQAGVPCPDPLHVIEVLTYHAAKANIKTKNKSAPATTASQIISKRNMKSVFANAMEAVQSQNELVSMSNLSICSLCNSRPISVMFVPCGHSVACAKCAKELGVLCPLCRATVERTVNV